LVGIFFHRGLADDKAVIQPFEQYGIGLFGGYDNGVIVRRIDARDFDKVGCL
jgi:hypothetical protein